MKPHYKAFFLIEEAGRNITYKVEFDIKNKKGHACPLDDASRTLACLVEAMTIELPYIDGSLKLEGKISKASLDCFTTFGPYSGKVTERIRKELEKAYLNRK